MHLRVRFEESLYTRFKVAPRARIAMTTRAFFSAHPAHAAAIVFTHARRRSASTFGAANGGKTVARMTAQRDVYARFTSAQTRADMRAPALGSPPRAKQFALANQRLRIRRLTHTNSQCID
ncbi:hypothetical protein ACFSQU_06260 [Massilia sp. GCM10020059]|uniref:Uncharacterized protein n=1 Tax=Massilia agrisoli TaxID=2892444 RepID=A0ABS8IXU0_9BURK|nr:hypothetical protein [Massilia agrisoli]MCC6073320.1 hypothetical protein [Massilia agrisoli]